MLRPFLIAVAMTVLALLLYGLLVVALFRLDVRQNLRVEDSSIVLASVFYVLPYALGAWTGTRSGLRDLPPRSAALAASAGALAPMLVVLVVTWAGGSAPTGARDVLGLLLPLAGVAVGAALAVRSARSLAKL